MSFRISTFYCRLCKQGTPHEFDPETQRSRCITCGEKAQKKNNPPKVHQGPQPTETERHLAALDAFPHQKRQEKKK